MIGKGLKNLQKSLTIFVVILIAAVDTILYVFKASLNLITIIDLIIALGFALLYFDERIEKLEKNNERIKTKLNKKGVTQLVAVILFILLLLLLASLISNQPISEIIGANLTRP